MMKLSCSEKILSPVDQKRGAHSAKPVHLYLRAEKISLRRSHFFKEAEHYDEVAQLSDTAEKSPSGIGQQALTHTIKNDDFDAKQQMIARNLRLMVDIAKRYTDRGVSLFDQIKKDNPGLVYALENFGVEDRFCFAAYATQCICQHIERALMNQNIASALSRAAPVDSFDNAAP